MENRSEAIGELLLSRLPQPANLAAYQQEVRSLLAENEKRLRRNKWTVRRVWIFVIAVSIPCLYMVATNPFTPEGNWFLGTVYFWVLFGVIEIAKYENKEEKTKLLKELKQIELQIVQLQDSLSKSGAS